MRETQLGVCWTIIHASTAIGILIAVILVGFQAVLHYLRPINLAILAQSSLRCIKVRDHPQIILQLLLIYLIILILAHQLQISLSQRTLWRPSILPCSVLPRP